MEKLINALARLGSSELTNIIGADTISILESLNSKQVASHKLADLLAHQFGPTNLLFNSSIRQNIIESLSKEDASKLCESLGLSPTEDPWSTAIKCRFDKKNANSQALCEFFDCPPLNQEDDKQLPDDIIKIEPDYQLFDHQILACRKSISYLKDTHRPRVLLHMPTGAGKTRTAMNIISHLVRDQYEKNDLVVWLAHSEELCEQAAEEFEKAWRVLGIRSLNIHRCYGAHRLELSNITSGVLIGGLQLMFKRSQNKQKAFLELARKTKLIIMDEAHQATAPTYQHILEILAADPNTAILGLSATPGRSTLDAHADLELANFFGRKKVTLEVDGYSSPIEYLQDEGYLATVTYQPLEYDPHKDFELSSVEYDSLQSGLDVPASLLKKLGADEKRNLLVLNEILQESDDQKSKIIVFACSVEQAHLIANILTIKGIKAGALTGKTDSEHRRNLIYKYRDTDDIQVLTNFGVLTTGFDAPRTNVAVIARPTNSVVLYSQMIGRASRGTRAGGNKKCKVITIVDKLPGFRNVAEAFEYWDEIWE